jgi:heme oxygenase
MKREDLFEMLKRETAVVHENVMDEAWAQRVLSEDYTVQEYGELLKKYYGFYLPLETTLLKLTPSLYPTSRIKYTLLQDDLNFLNARVASDLRNFPKLPLITDNASALGTCYVLEGATLGGQMISKNLKNSLGLSPSEGLKFFTGYGQETGKMWSTFKSNARGMVETSVEIKSMLGAALETFRSLSEWMRAP